MENRMESTQRVLTVLEIVSGLRFGRTRAELRASLAELGICVCDRTVRRDLDLLLGLRLIETELTQRGRVYRGGRVKYVVPGFTVDGSTAARSRVGWEVLQDGGNQGGSRGGGDYRAQAG